MSSGGEKNRSGWLSRVGSYTANVLMSYAQFVGPIAVFLAFNMVVVTHTRDPEKHAITWMHYASITDENERQSTFPIQKSRGGNNNHHDDEDAE